LKKLFDLIKKEKYPVIYGLAIILILFIVNVPEGQRVKIILGSFYSLACDRNVSSCDIRIKNP